MRTYILSDAFSLMSGYVLAWLLATFVNTSFLGRGMTDMMASQGVARLLIFLTVTCGVLLWLSSKNHYRMRLPFWTEAQHIVYAILACILVDSFLQFATKQDLSRLWLISTWVFGGILLLLMRAFVRRWLRRHDLWNIRTILIGSGQTAEDARLAIEAEQHLGYVITSQIENLSAALAAQQGSWSALCRHHAAQQVLLALDGAELQAAERELTALTREGVPYAICPPLRGLPLLGMEAQYFFSHDVMLLSRCNRLEQPLPRFMKRSFDIICATAGLLLLTPLFLVVAALIKRDGGPIFYFDRRIGGGGKAFACIKFRSMVLDADKVLTAYLADNADIKKEWDEFRKLRGYDPRVTAIGRFIRKTSIDELPQLFNVIIGDMSLVGPRPIMANELAQYGIDMDFYRAMRPGITGLWQVSGRNSVSYERRVQLDRWYISNWSLWLDIAILCKTVPVVLFRKGAF